MSRRKLKLVNYDHDYVDYEDDVNIRRFIATIEETHLRRRDDAWPAKLLDEGDDIKWKAEIDKYIGELGIPQGCTRKAAIDYVLNCAIDVAYKDNENAKTLTSVELKRRTSELLEQYRDSQNPLNRIDYTTTQFVEQSRALCELLGITQHTDPVLSLKAACIFISENINDDVLLATNSETAKNLKMMDIKAFPLGIPDRKDASVNFAARVLRLVNVEQLRIVQTKINEILVAIQNLTIDMSKTPDLAQIQYGR